ncbi:curli assembly protein CsgF [Derxia gummosa]|uniref:Curli production assembly/transport component CsgF n=1 Tax=Derxia gummosa DSM 723 TaxID=1121388 RepID=A0A8B6X4P0_9BURK|nr:curli assembly protein CsgF [Derxia gummosa]
MKLRSIALATACFASIPAFSTELVYVPINPVFGGSPLNGAVLLNNAQAENKKVDPASKAASSRTNALKDFNDSLQRVILSRLASAASTNIFNSDGRLIPGTIETGDFRITILDTGGGVLSITTIDKATGESTTFQVSQ